LCYFLFLPNVAKHIQLNDSPERFLVDYRGHLQAGLYLAPQCSQESPLDIEHQSAENRILVPCGTHGNVSLLGHILPPSYLVSRPFWPSSLLLFANP
jgi:hypothetical protein